MCNKLKNKQEYLNYQKEYYKKKKKKNKIPLTFEEQTIKENLKIEKRRTYYRNKRYDLLNKPIIYNTTKKDLILEL